ncbi:Hypothetical predicted protein [Cloeon dipterum]|uniref:Endocuticle structural glycoprotein SgAbd-2 n=1 Tax=Cloeon dipterum TaxID=197152 RepID=A0A8S1DF55_9INSE|nr:Hypothetical predicted protein [Cloeon dipterum]
MYKLAICLALFAVAFARPQEDKDATALRHEQDGPNVDGSYKYSYETSNGITVDEKGFVKPNPAPSEPENTEIQVAEGSFSFTDKVTGQKFSITYTADENGFQARGDHLPTPPPIPEALQRAIELATKALKK